MGFGFGQFNLMRAIFLTVFLTVFGIVIYVFIQAFRQWHYNKQQPRLSVEATAVSKRTEVSTSSTPVAGDATGAHGFTSSSSTWYYVTFEVESGDRMEFSVSGSDYGMIAEGDFGKLSFQGTRFLSFERYR
ncbi:MAG: DUF2500 domain-containing protein [Erysipelotrichaceae bacterium]|nr:DUF2500 domain-containing protein [Erysipelotrichaceae bacterium]